MRDNNIAIKLSIPDEKAGMRLDQALSQLLSDYSRARIQQWIHDGNVLLDGKTCKPRDKVSGSEEVSIDVELEPEGQWLPQDIPLEIIYEDEDIIVVNKPIGLIVHPGAGVPDGTLVNALLHYDINLQKLPRAGIVHRLDKDTSGLLVIARSIRAHTSLIDQLQTKTMQREYAAIVNGELSSGGTVDASIGRHPKNRLKMAVVNGGKTAVTHYRIKEQFTKYTYVHCQLETGRTHQIRVHMAHIGHALLGDAVYGTKSDKLKQKLRRQALHAARLTLKHPGTGKAMTFESPLPKDIEEILELLRNDYS